MSFTVGIIGGGVAGSTIAIKLCQIGVKSVLFQSSSTLVSGPPMCHLHAGGALYREIPTYECIKLLIQSINTLKCYKFSANLRPTLLTVPIRDNGSPETIIHRMKIIKSQYEKLVNQDKSNEVLGKPDDFYKVFTKQQIYKLREMQIPNDPKTPQQWMIPPAKFLNLQKFKFPFVMVQEYGLSSMRVSAYANLFLQKNNKSKIFLNTKVIGLKKIQKKWMISYKKNDEVNQKQLSCDFIVNACGYQSGIIDDMVGLKKKRLLQLKASYVSNWSECKGKWPEVIVHGTRNTPQGMVQLTPYPNKYFQIHGMTDKITLFKNGLVQSNDSSSQPHFNQEYEELLAKGWSPQNAIQRTRRAIDFVSQFVPSFRSAIQTSNPLWGVQQIPGTNPDLRASEITYEGDSYARAQIVKASTAIQVAQELIQKFRFQHKINNFKINNQQQNISMIQVLERAKKIAKERNYPPDLAQFYC